MAPRLFPHERKVVTAFILLGVAVAMASANWASAAWAIACQIQVMVTWVLEDRIHELS